MQSSCLGTNINFPPSSLFSAHKVSPLSFQRKSKNTLCERNSTKTDIETPHPDCKAPDPFLPLVPPPGAQSCLCSGRTWARVGWVPAAGVVPTDSPLTESKDSCSFSTKFSGGRIPRAGLLMNVLCKKAQRQTVMLGPDPAPCAPTSLLTGMGSRG